MGSPSKWRWHNDLEILRLWSVDHTSLEVNLVKELMEEVTEQSTWPEFPGAAARGTSTWAHDDACRMASNGACWIGFLAERDKYGDAGTLFLVDIKGPQDPQFYYTSDIMGWSGVL